jgi:hypothetical protein
MNQDNEHLNLLAVFHFVLAGLGAFVACFPILHLVIGIVVLVAPASIEIPDEAQIPRVLFGVLFTVIPLTIILVGWTIAFLIYRAGRCLQRHESYTFCLVMAGVMCLFMPLGTALGVFTIIVLMRPTVKTMFEEAALKSF